MSAGEFCNRDVVVMGRTEPAIEAARLMRDHHVGDVVVIDERDGKRYPKGIVTDRDLVLELLAPDAGGEAGALAVQDLVTEPLLTAYEEDSVLETLKRMRAHGVRRMPVIAADGSLAGILTVDDFIGLVAEALGDLAGLADRARAHEARTRR